MVRAQAAARLYCVTAATATGYAERCGKAIRRYLPSRPRPPGSSTPVQLGHEIASHTIDPGDQGHHGGQRHPCRDLAHVAVLLHANMSQGGLDERGQHLVKVVDLFRRVVLVLDDLTDVARQSGGMRSWWSEVIWFNSADSGLIARRSSTISRLSR